MDINLFPKPKPYSDMELLNAENYLKENLSTVTMPYDFLVQLMNPAFVIPSPWAAPVQIGNYTLSYHGIDNAGKAEAVQVLVGTYKFLPMVTISQDSEFKFLIGKRNDAQGVWEMIPQRAWIYVGYSFTPPNVDQRYKIITSEDELEMYISFFPQLNLSVSIYYQNGVLYFGLKDIAENNDKTDMSVASYLDHIPTYFQSEYNQRLLYRTPAE